jgi:RND superfamily putative drug exporter
MQSAMNRLSVFVRTRRKLVLGLWVGLLLVSIPFASQQTKHLTGSGFEVPGSGSDQVDRQIKRFAGQSAEPLGVVLQAKGGDVAAAVDGVAKAAATVAHVELSGEAAAAAKQAAGGQDVVVMPLQVTGTRDDALKAAADLRTELSVGKVTDGVQPYVVGQQALWAGMQELQQKDLAKAESTGFPAILIVLLAVFGSVLAALLPVLLGVAAVIVTGAAIFLLSLGMTMSLFVTNVASMLGIGVAVDYSLFLLSRYREELEHGKDRAEALDIAMRTSGATVVFSGITVIVSVAGLFLLDSTVMRSLAIGAIIVVAIGIIGAVSLLPALVAVFGRRVEQRGRIVSFTGSVLRRIKPKRERAPGAPTFWQSWTGRLMRRPALYAAAAAAVLLLIAVPAMSLKFGNGALRQFPPDNETRVGAELAGKQVTPGATAPTIVVADFKSGTASDPASRAALDKYVAGVKQTAGVADVSAPVVSEDGKAALLRVIPAQDPESDATLRLISTLRDEGGRAAGLSRMARVNVGGPTAQTKDFAGLISGGLWKVFAFVVICSYLVLLIVLRSVLLPLKAVIMNLLSVGAGYGVLVAVFQYGWLDGITGYDSLGYINAATPPLLLAIVFGLSMDYEVFLLSRIRERYKATGDNRLAVSEGLQQSAKVITSAAVIMVVVFGVFALTGVPQIKEIGVGLAVAIGLDATLVRLVLVPSTMGLMGKWNWWLPKSLDRILPNADFETDHAPEEDRAVTAVA